MNKIGRKRVEKLGMVTRASREFMNAGPEYRAFVEASTAIEVGAYGRWLAWRPVTEPDVGVGQTMEDFIMNTQTVTRTQWWEVRFIGRRDRNRYLRKRASVLTL